MNVKILPRTVSASGSRDYPGFPDEALLALASRGDERALAELYDRYSRIAYGLALRIVRDPALAEDAVQEAFVTVWRTAGSFMPGRAKASTWILTLVHRRAVDVVRPDGRAVVMSTLSRAPSGKTYELWVIDNGGAKSAGLFPGGRSNPVVLTRPVPKGAQIGLSLERAGGAEHPTVVLSVSQAV